MLEEKIFFPGYFVEKKKVLMKFKGKKFLGLPF